MTYPDWMRAGVGHCGNCGRMESLYRWVTTEGHRGVSCEECATQYGWFVPSAPSPAEVPDQSAKPVGTSQVPTPPLSMSQSYEPDTFGKWVVRGIAIAIGFLIVEIPLVVIAMWWLNHQLSKVGF